MPSDIIVTTPKSEMPAAAAEAQQCIRDGGGHYFRRLNARPYGVCPGSKVFYVEDGYIRGYATVCAIITKEDLTFEKHISLGLQFSGMCHTTSRSWGPGVYLIMPAKSWRWIEPIAMKGFRGWRYFKQQEKVKEIGGWLDPKPKVPGREQSCQTRMDIPQKKS